MPHNCVANHIIGGEITYQCTSSEPGNFVYEFRMDIYRDCASNGADFDETAVIGFYLFNGADYTFLRSEIVPLSQVFNVPPPNIPCVVIPPGVCVEQGAYTFSIQTSEAIDQSLVATYQRCCRGRGISNISAELVGATYFIEVSPTSQVSCNNSPKFKDFPPSVICVNEPLEFDHGAIDTEGDSLIYEFCAPLVGGGVRGAQQGDTDNDALRCDGVTPDPSVCTPTFSPLTYRPDFSARKPILGNPNVSIDRFTGLITGTPNVLGAYVVGICVSEYRDGVKIGEIRRDFQFNITSCDKAVLARIDADEEMNGEDFIVRSCGDLAVNFTNQSGDARLIDNYFWEFDIDGVASQAFVKDASFNFPKNGVYDGLMIINRGTNCTDTANVTVEVFPEINADFKFEYDTCVAEPVQFTNLSSSGAGFNAISTIEWEFGDQNVSMERSPSHLYSEPGAFPVELHVRDINGCEDETINIVRYFPVPPLVLVEPSAFEGCTPGSIDFVNLSEPINEQYTIRWDFGDGGTSNELSPNHIYNLPGIYTVDLQLESPIGCRTSDRFVDLITIRPSPTAAFTYSPLNPTSIEPHVDFMDESIDAVSWLWDLENDSMSMIQNPFHSFQNTGIQNVVLEVTHANGCKDETSQLIDIEPIIRYYLPDVFSPNNDAQNDLFLGSGIIDGIQEFSMSVYGRWGNLIFQTRDPFEGWNGRIAGTNADAPTGIYVCLVKYKDVRGTPFVRSGSITLVR